MERSRRTKASLKGIDFCPDAGNEDTGGAVKK
jgi:hypothetical protein